MDVPNIPVPIHTDEHGRIMIDGTRIPIDTVIACYHQGDTPERIHSGFPTLKLTVIYTLIGYYLQHQEEIDEYLRQQEEEAKQLRRQLEAEHPEMFVLQEKLRKLLAERAK